MSESSTPDQGGPLRDPLELFGEVLGELLEQVVPGFVQDTQGSDLEDLENTLAVLVTDALTGKPKNVAEWFGKAAILTHRISHVNAKTLNARAGEVDRLLSENNDLLAEKDGLQAELAAASSALIIAEQQVSELQKSDGINQLKMELRDAHDRIVDKNWEYEKLKLQSDQAQMTLDRKKQELSNVCQKLTALEDTVFQLKQEAVNLCLDRDGLEGDCLSANETLSKATKEVEVLKE